MSSAETFTTGSALLTTMEITFSLPMMSSLPAYLRITVCMPADNSLKTTEPPSPSTKTVVDSLLSRFTATIPHNLSLTSVFKLILSSTSSPYSA